MNAISSRPIDSDDQGIRPKLCKIPLHLPLSLLYIFCWFPKFGPSKPPMYCSNFLFLLFFAGLLFISSNAIKLHNASKSIDCEFGHCTRWRILLVPLLTDRFHHISLLKAIVRSMLSGCPWYFPQQVQLQLLVPKNDTFLPVTDPIALPVLDQMLDQLKFTARERQARHGQWRRTVELAVERMDEEEFGPQDASSAAAKSTDQEGAQEEVGRFIFVVTDFERHNSGYEDDEFLEELDRQLAQSRIHFRNVRLQFDKQKHTQQQMVPPASGGRSDNVQDTISNVSSYIVRVALVEQQDGLADAFAAIRPCPPLSDAERIREYSYVQHFYYRNWFMKNPRGALIGLALFLFAMLCAVCAYLFHLWERRRAARRAQRALLSEKIGNDGGGSTTE